jgi:hypothetical protein
MNGVHSPTQIWRKLRGVDTIQNRTVLYQKRPFTNLAIRFLAGDEAYFGILLACNQ